MDIMEKKSVDVKFTCVVNGALLLWLLLVTITMTTGMEVGEDTPISPAGQVWLNSLFYLPDTPRVRKEYRVMSDEERDNYHDAFLQLKNDTSVEPNKWDLFVSLHARRSSRNSAHRGTGFLGWHRVYILLMENALREKVPNVTMPYWDCTLDAVLPRPRDSSIWTGDFIGNGDGHVDKGVFKDWTTVEGRLYRTVGKRFGPLADKNITRLMSHDHIGEISYPTDRRKDIEDIIELTHNRLHNWVGGEMKTIETAAQDPIFYMYHSFISYIWEDFRNLQRSKGIDPELDWDENYGPKRHHKYSPMGLGNLMAIDGSSEIFMQNIVFTKRPWCNYTRTDCGTPYLYCNVPMEKCVPWTIDEYKNIKYMAKLGAVSFAESAASNIRTKIRAGKSLVDRQKTENVNTELDNQPDDHSHVDNGEDNHGHPDDGHSHSSKDQGHSLNGGHDDMGQGHSHGEGQNHDMGQGHSHGESESEEGHHHDNDGHEGHDHTHVNQLLNSTVNNDIKLIDEKLVLIILAALVIFRILFAIITKCVKGKKKSGRSKRRYNMNGIINVNFDEDGNKVTDTEDRIAEGRSDNIYTITVTSTADSSATFVRFAKFNTGVEVYQNRSTGMATRVRNEDTDSLTRDKTKGISLDQYKIVKNIENHKDEDLCTDIEKNTSNRPERLCRKSEVDDKNLSKNKDNYLDMDYGSQVISESVLKDQTLENMFETDADIQERDGLDIDTLDTDDEQFNSIENENFDLPMFEAKADSNVRETYAVKLSDQDIFDDYDNLVFRKEPERREAADAIKDADDTELNLDYGKFYSEYFPSTHM